MSLPADTAIASNDKMSTVLIGLWGGTIYTCIFYVLIAEHLHPLLFECDCNLFLYESDRPTDILRAFRKSVALLKKCWHRGLPRVERMTPDSEVACSNPTCGREFTCNLHIPPHYTNTKQERKNGRISLTWVNRVNTFTLATYGWEG